MGVNGQGADILELTERDWTGPPVSGSDLARGLMLLRASNMNVIRLQLAMERSDRRTAMEALDGLVALDREIDGFIGEMPSSDADFAAMARRIDRQKTAIASEKLIFGAGRHGPAIAPRADEIVAAEPGEALVSLEASTPAEDPTRAEAIDEWFEEVAAETPARRGWWLAAAMAMLVLAAGIAFLLLADTGAAAALARMMEIG